MKDERDDLERRVVDLEKSLRVSQNAERLARQRADAAEESARRAWRLSGDVPRPRRQE